MTITEYTNFGLNSKSFKMSGRPGRLPGDRQKPNLNRFDIFQASFVWISLVETSKAGVCLQVGGLFVIAAINRILFILGRYFLKVVEKISQLILALNLSLY